MDTEPVKMGIREFRDNFGPRVRAAHYHGEATIATEHGEPMAVLVPYAEWQAWHRKAGPPKGDPA